MKIFKKINTLIITILIFNLNCFAQGSIAGWEKVISEKEKQIIQINSEINNAENESMQNSKQLENAKNNTKNKKLDYDKSKDLYERGSKNVDIIAPEDLVKLLKEYQKVNEVYTNAKEEEEKINNLQTKINSEITRLKKQKSEKEKEILEVKAKMFTEEMSKPVWATGFGESILDENKTMKECQRLALDYAKRDAMDKGGKTIIESLTKVEDFMLIKDVIKSRATVQIIDQDYSGDYGKAIRVDHGDLIKFEASVRLQLKSIDTYNPYREKLDTFISTDSDERNVLDNQSILKYQKVNPVKVKSIKIISATYGGNCGARKGNVTSQLASYCNGKISCTYIIDHKFLGDPAYMCRKDFVVEWVCGLNSTTHVTQVAPEAGLRKKLILDCQD